MGLEPFAASNEDGYFDFAIANHWDCRSEYGLDILRILSLVMLRRTKSMHIIDTGMPLLGLKHLTVRLGFTIIFVHVVLIYHHIFIDRFPLLFVSSNLST